ncbi:hypothetical protein ACA910_010569 [Epithemia clementina (nom. ined.)]
MVLLNDNRSHESYKDDNHGDLSDNHPAKMAAEEDDEGAVAPQAKRLPSRAARRHQISRSTSRQNHSNKNANQSNSSSNSSNSNNSNNSKSKRSYKALPDASSSSTSMYTHRYNSSPSLLYVPPPFMRPDQSPAHLHNYHLQQQQQQQDHLHPQQHQQRRAKATVASLLSASEKTSSLERVGTPATFSRSDRTGSTMPTIRSARTATTTAPSRLEKDENLHPNSNQEHVLSTSAGSKCNRTDARHLTCPSESGGASSSTASNSSSTIGRRAADAVSRFRAMKRRIQEEEERQKHKEKMLQQQRQREPQSRSGIKEEEEEPEKDNDKNQGHHVSSTPAQPPPPPPLLPLMVPQGRPSFIRPRLLSMASPSLPTIAEIVPGMTSESSSSSWDCSRASPASNSMSKSPYRPHPSWHQQQPPSQHERVEINSRTGHDKTTSRRSSTSLQPSFFSATNPTTPTRTQSSPRGYPQTPPSPLLVPLLPSIIMAPEGGKDHIGTPPTGRGGIGRDKNNNKNNMDSGYETTEASPVTSTPSSSSSSSPVACSPSDSLDLPLHPHSRSNSGTTTAQPPLSLEASHPPRSIATTTTTTTSTSYRSAPYYSQPGRPSSRSPAVSASSTMAERSPSLSYVQRRRFRTVVPVRVFLESSDFFVPEHDSFLNLMPDEEQLYANMYARATSTSAPAVKVLL